MRVPQLSRQRYRHICATSLVSCTVLLLESPSSQSLLVVRHLSVLSAFSLTSWTKTTHFLSYSTPFPCTTSLPLCSLHRAVSNINLIMIHCLYSLHSTSFAVSPSPRCCHPQSRLVRTRAPVTPTSPNSPAPPRSFTPNSHSFPRSFPRYSHLPPLSRSLCSDFTCLTRRISFGNRLLTVASTSRNVPRPVRCFSLQTAVCQKCVPLFLFQYFIVPLSCQWCTTLPMSLYNPPVTVTARHSLYDYFEILSLYLLEFRSRTPTQTPLSESRTVIRDVTVLITPVTPCPHAHATASPLTCAVPLCSQSYTTVPARTTTTLKLSRDHTVLWYPARRVASRVTRRARPVTTASPMFARSALWVR
jgi:hypothetical protein